MLFPSRRIKLIIIVGTGVVLAAVLLWLGMSWGSRQNEVTANQNTNTARQGYADLYQAAWRPDAGQGNITMSATLFVPPLIDLLGQDAGKSDAENQLWRAVKDTTSNQIAIFLTIDSVSGPQSDQAIRDSLTLADDRGTLTLTSWNPLIFPSRIINTAEPANSQSGVAIFSANTIVDWTAVTNLHLISRHPGGVDARNFIWANPSLLFGLPV